MRTYRITLLLMVLAVIAIAAPLASAQETPIEDVNRQLIEAYAQAELDRNYDLMDEYLAEDFVRHSNSPTAPVIENRDAFKAFLQETAAMFPDYGNSLDMLVVDPTVVSAQATFAGTFVGNGERIEFPFTAFWRIDEGKIAELWVNWNDLDMLPQMGLLPPVEELMAPAVPESAADEIAIVVEHGEALNEGDVDTAISYYAENASFSSLGMEPSYHIGKTEIRELFENLVAGNFRIEHNIIATYANDSILISDTQTWADPITEMGFDHWTATEVYVVQDGLITSVTWVLSDDIKDQLMAAMAPPPVTAADIIGTWRHWSGFYFQFRPDGTYRAVEAMTDHAAMPLLNADTPDDGGSYSVADNVLTLVTGEAGRYCEAGDVAKYALEFGDHGNVNLTLQSDDCAKRKFPSTEPQPFIPVEGEQ